MSAILVTGAAGFIGSSFIRVLKEKQSKVIILDALTYAGHKENLSGVLGDNIELIEGDICDFPLLERIFCENKISGVAHFAAESHVDNSISGPKSFIDTNIIGTFNLLEISRKYWQDLTELEKKSFRFLHVSTDEVFGELGKEGKFSETTPYAPNSPYSASKAASDHLVRAWHHTYGLPTITTNCSNNYGPRQFPEKLIPRMILCAIQGENLPVYGDGSNVRDWIHVEDHCHGIWLAFEKGEPGATYCFGGDSERTNLEVVENICNILDQHRPKESGSYKDQITFVKDRLGHDFRYAIDDTYAQKQLGFTRQFSQFENGLEATIKWYLENTDWISSVMEKKK